MRGEIHKNADDCLEDANIYFQSNRRVIESKVDEEEKSEDGMCSNCNRQSYPHLKCEKCQKSLCKKCARDDIFANCSKCKLTFCCDDLSFVPHHLCSGCSAQPKNDILDIEEEEKEQVSLQSKSLE